MSKTFLSALVAGLAALPLAAGAATTTYTFNLDGAQETPPVLTSAVGSFMMTLDDIGTISFASASFGVTSPPPFAAHIHMGMAGTSGAVVFDLGAVADTVGPVTIGLFTVPDSFAFATTSPKGIDPALVAMINAAPWDYYVNIHSSIHPTGEIRGQLAPVPEPGTYALLAVGLGVVSVVARRRQTA